MLNDDLNVKIGAVADIIVGSRKMVVFTGAVVSTESGIPDFRSPGVEMGYESPATVVDCQVGPEVELNGIARKLAETGKMFYRRI